VRHAEAARRCGGRLPDDEPGFFHQRRRPAMAWWRRSAAVTTCRGNGRRRSGFVPCRPCRWSASGASPSSTCPRASSGSTAHGRHQESLESERPIGECMLLQFHRKVTSLVRAMSGLDDALKAMQIVQAAATSQAEGRRVALLDRIPRRWSTGKGAAKVEPPSQGYAHRSSGVRRPPRLPDSAIWRVIEITPAARRRRGRRFRGCRAPSCRLPGSSSSCR